METWIQTELDSGERVISERLPHVRSATIGYWIGAGSRDETDARAGISHFIEHLLFKGSSRYNALEIAEIFDEMGGELTPPPRASTPSSTGACRSITSRRRST